MSSRPNYTKRFILGRSLGHAYFWGSISIPYLVYRNFSIQEAFTLVGLYSLLVVILEFPTGIIGDLYGHKFSVNLSNILGALTFLILAQPLPHWGYYLLIFLAASSSSLSSGSDVAMLHTLSSDFKKDLAVYRTYCALAALVALSTAGYLATISYSLPLYLTTIVWLISAAIIQTIPASHNNSQTSGNIFAQASSSITIVLRNIPLLAIISYAAINSGFDYSIKTIINSFGAELHFSLPSIGLLVGFSFLVRLITLKLATKAQNLRIRQLFIAMAMAITFMIILPPSYLSLIILALSSSLVTLIALRADYSINEIIPDGYRASILSLKSLLMRLVSSLYLILAGQLIGIGKFQGLMFATLIIYTVAGLIFIKLSSHHAKLQAK